MRSPTVGGYAIANLPHLLTLGRQVVERLQVLQTNGVLAIPGFDCATELTHVVDYAPAPTFAPEFGVVFSKNLAYFAQLVGIGYFGAFHNLLHHIFDDAMRWYFTEWQTKAACCHA
ncbi:MAG: hypothetical protein ICV54_29165 [Nostoc sp. C3-bin3]|nr:hypothetical protein [Nostoc sp. C3-bin3]